MAKNEKIIGYILLALGVAMLFFAVFEMWSVYTGGTTAPNLFNLSDLSMPVGDPNGGSATITLIQGDQLSQLPNLFFWFILMSFVLLAGGKIAQIGVNMIKDIKVEVKEALSRPPEAQA